MSSSCRISVVVPVYNGGKLLRKSLRPFVLAGDPRIEIVVVDDASTDDTADRIKVLDKVAGGLKYVAHSTNRGPLAARLTGAKEAVGEYVAFLDCGDAMKVDGLLRLHREASARKADMAVGGMDLVIGLLGSLRYSNPKSSYTAIIEGEDDESKRSRLAARAMLEGGLTGVMIDKLYKREWLLAHLPKEIDSKVGEDYYFSVMTVPFVRRMIFTDISFYRWMYSGLASKYFLERYGENAKTTERVFQSLREVFPTDGLSLKDSQRAVARKYIYQVMLGVAEALCSRSTRGDADEWAAKMFDTNAMRLSLSAIDSFKGVAAADLTPRKMTQLAREHIKRHKKYYIFTRILGLIYRR